MLSRPKILNRFCRLVEGILTINDLFECSSIRLDQLVHLLEIKSRANIDAAAIVSIWAEPHIVGGPAIHQLTGGSLFCQ